MSGYMFAIGHCVRCDQRFTFNPDLVPSIRVNGEREPVCKNCIAWANTQRAANGLPLLEIMPGAYEPGEA